jgi:hypothetical protein
MHLLVLYLLDENDWSKLQKEENINFNISVYPKYSGLTL